MATKTKTTEKNGANTPVGAALESVWVRAFKTESEWPDKVNPRIIFLILVKLMPFNALDIFNQVLFQFYSCFASFKMYLHCVLVCS